VEWLAMLTLNIFVWIPREQNSEADMLSRVAYKRYLRKKIEDSSKQ